MYLGLKNVKVIRVPAATDTENIERRIELELKDGWVLMDISTVAPSKMPGQYGSDNYIMYHFGKFNTEVPQ